MTHERWPRSVHSGADPVSVIGRERETRECSRVSALLLLSGLPRVQGFVGSSRVVGFLDGRVTGSSGWSTSRSRSRIQNSASKTRRNMLLRVSLLLGALLQRACAGSSFPSFGDPSPRGGKRVNSRRHKIAPPALPAPCPHRHPSPRDHSDHVHVMAHAAASRVAEQLTLCASSGADAEPEPDEDSDGPQKPRREGQRGQVLAPARIPHSTACLGK